MKDWEGERNRKCILCYRNSNFCSLEKATQVVLSATEEGRSNQDVEMRKILCFLKRATISICIWESIIMEIYGNLTHNIFRTTCRQLWTTKVFWNYEKREENEMGFYVISDYETNSVFPVPSAAVASSTELWANKNCQCKSHNNQTLRQY